MKIRQNLIDNIVNSDRTREELAEQLLQAKYTSGMLTAEVKWLDQLADLLRDGEVGQDIIYQEYQDELSYLLYGYGLQRITKT